MNEVRLIAASFVDHAGVFTTERAIKWKPEASVLGLASGDPISISVADFARLLDAYLASITRAFC